MKKLLLCSITVFLFLRISWPVYGATITYTEFFSLDEDFVGDRLENSNKPTWIVDSEGSTTITFPGFDYSLGQLTSVGYILNATAASNVKINVSEISSSAKTDGDLSYGFYQADDPMWSLFEVSDWASGFPYRAGAEAPDSIIISSPGEYDLWSYNRDVSKEINYNIYPDDQYYDFLESYTFEFVYNLNKCAFWLPVDQVTSSVFGDVSWSGQVAISYNYNPAPEPSTIFLFCFGLSSLIVIKRKRN